LLDSLLQEMSSNGNGCNSSPGVNIEDFILELAKVEAVKFGSFTLKSGQISPVYFDLRVLVSYPKLMSITASLLLQASPHSSNRLLCGVPYTALPMATIMSVESGAGMVVRRKEAKDYGTKKMVEGVWTQGQSCLVVEDVVTTGGSVLDTAKLLRELGMSVTECVVLLNREQGAVEALAREGVQVKSVLTVSQVLKVLVAKDKMKKEMADSVTQFLAGNQTPEVPTLSLSKRLDMMTNSVGRRLVQIMLEKESNLCVAVDSVTSEEVIRLVQLVAPHVVMVKLHLDLVGDWDTNTESRLVQLATNHNFLLFEDRKLADIGATVGRQADQFVGWADIVTVHGLPGPGVLDGLTGAAVRAGREVGALIVSQMSNKENLATGEYTKSCVALGESHKDSVVGFISQSVVSKDPGLLHLTPGVHLTVEGDGGDQRYVTPSEAVVERGADIVIVGRGITGHKDPGQVVLEYKREAWTALKQKITL